MRKWRKGKGGGSQCKKAGSRGREIKDGGRSEVGKRGVGWEKKEKKRKGKKEKRKEKEKKILRAGFEPATYGFQRTTTVHRSTN